MKCALHIHIEISKCSLQIVLLNNLSHKMQQMCQAQLLYIFMCIHVFVYYPNFNCYFIEVLRFTFCPLIHHCFTPTIIESGQWYFLVYISFYHIFRFSWLLYPNCFKYSLKNIVLTVAELSVMIHLSIIICIPYISEEWTIKHNLVIFVIFVFVSYIHLKW